MAKRYWLKTNAHFFKDSHLVYLKSLKNGYEYIYLWQCLLLKCLEVDDEADCGFLRLNDKIPYSPELLAEIFNMNIDVVKNGVELFVNLNMMSILENGTLYIESVQKMIGRESESAERVRLHRERKLLHCNSDVTKSNPILSINTNINKEIEKEPQLQKQPQRNKKPTPQEIKDYCIERNNTVDPEKFFDYYEANGWRVGKNPMKDWKAAVRTWEKNSFKTSDAKPKRSAAEIMAEFEEEKKRRGM